MDFAIRLGNSVRHLPEGKWFEGFCGILIAEEQLSILLIKEIFRLVEMNFGIVHATIADKNIETLCKILLSFVFSFPFAMLL